MAASPEQLDELLTYCINFARTMLNASGDFYPFAATLSLDGNVAAVGGYNGEEQPRPAEIYELLSGAFSAGARAGQHLGVALAANVNIPAQYSPEAPDGLRVHLESNGFARFIYVPYKIDAQGVATIAEPFSVQIPPVFFGNAGNA